MEQICAFSREFDAEHDLKHGVAFFYLESSPNSHYETSLDNVDLNMVKFVSSKNILPPELLKSALQEMFQAIEFQTDKLEAVAAE